ncbi:MAG: trypsin-like peptidase domain-containing protein [Hyphomonadaceae bacterium]|nr:trypsin-like peptidase domain-containing protein [Hyphomonadaceae bacterium]
MTRFPDWLVYILVTGALVLVLFGIDRRSDAPPALSDSGQIGPLLPPPSIYDPDILVDVGPVSSGLGTAFAISQEGWWLTARHVVDACNRVGIVVSRNTAIQVKEVRVARFADLALLQTDRAPGALALDDKENRLQIGQSAFHVGFPQGRTGEASSRLIGRETLVARGRYQFEQPVLAWAETGRTGNLQGTLSGISGGPTIDEAGRVIGVTVAESARRGRIYTASPASIARFLEVEQTPTDGAPTARLTRTNYGQRSDELRRSLTVAQVVCIANEGQS